MGSLTRAGLILLCCASFLGARSFVNPTVGYSVVAPDDWQSTLAPNGTALRLTRLTDEGVTVTFRSKTVSGAFSSKMVTRRFKAEYRHLRRTERDAKVVTRPSQSKVGPYNAIAYAFSFRNFIDEVLTTETYWFNTRTADNSTLLFKATLSGTTEAFKTDKVVLASLRKSFAMTWRHDVAAAQGEDVGSGGSSSGGGSDHGSHVVGTDDSGGGSTDTYSHSGRPSITERVGKKPYRPAVVDDGFDPSKYYGKKKTSENVAGLFHAAKEVTDPEKLERLNRTFGERNKERTEAEQRRALQYFGGFKDTQFNREGVGGSHKHGH